MEGKSVQELREMEIAKNEQDIAGMKQGVINNSINAVLCIFFMCVTLLVLIQALRIARQSSGGQLSYPLREEPYIAMK